MEIINEIMTLYVRYVNDNLVNDLKEVGEEIAKGNLEMGLTYDELAKNIKEISGEEYFKEIKIERME
jgi:formiminotetrahydrofolate cyclodeaminase